MTPSDTNRKTFIIAEAGVNHNGCTSTALQLVREAANSGADAVKFQTFTADALATADTAKAAYQKKTTASAESQRDMLRRLELDEAAHREIMRECASLRTPDGRTIEFMSTPFDLPSLKLLTRLEIGRIKISSGDITNAPLLLHSAQTGLPVILSTGMSTLYEVREALAVLAYGMLHSNAPSGLEQCRTIAATQAAQALLQERVTLLHCTTQYPAPFEDVNLRCLHTLAETFGLHIGYSDHTQGIAVPVAAAALGATVIEKHFTLDKGMEGPDHKASLEPDEFAEMVRSIRIAEKALGSGEKRPAASERDTISVARKYLVAAANIRKGEQFTEHNITAKRSGGGLSPMRYWDIAGRRAVMDYAPDESIAAEDADT